MQSLEIYFRDQVLSTEAEEDEGLLFSLLSPNVYYFRLPDIKLNTSAVFNVSQILNVTVQQPHSIQNGTLTLIPNYQLTLNVFLTGPDKDDCSQVPVDRSLLKLFSGSSLVHVSVKEIKYLISSCN